MTINWKSILTVLFVTSFALSSCKKDEEEEPIIPTPTEEVGMFKIEFEHVYASANFALNTAYTTSVGEEVTWTKFNYYISNIELLKSDGSSWKQPESYFLVQLDNAASTLLTINNVPKADYTGLRFTLGVDSTRNVSGAQTGALDPANNMFWSWNNGYIFIKSEGTSPQSSTGLFEYHIGGFRNATNTNALNTMEFDFGGMAMSVKPNAAPQIHMSVSMDKFFSGTSSNLSVATLSDIHMPGAMAIGVANRFKDAYAFEHVHN